MPVEPAVVSITRIQGGFNQNIIQDSVELEGTVRTFNEDTRSRIARRMEEIIKGITMAHGATYELDYEYCYPAVVNSEEFTKGFVESAKKILEEEAIVEMKTPVMGAEDMSYFLQKAPGTFVFLNNPKQIEGEYYPHHSPKFDIDESQLWKGAAVMIQAAIDWLNQ